MGNQSDMTNAGSGLQTSAVYFIQSSTTLIVPFTGKMLVRSGAAAGSGARPPSGGNASGGGSGEHALDIVPVIKDDTVTITIGAGGAAVSVLDTVGNSGGDNTVACTGYAMVTKGGGGGQKAASGVVAGGLGGTGGTGGTAKVARFQGGRGGAITVAGTTNKLTGGGGFNLFGLTAQTATRGGDISYNDSTARSTGGGGCRARGGDITTNAVTATYSGGSGGNAADDAATLGTNYLGEAQSAAPTGMLTTGVAVLPFNYFSGGSNGAGADGGGGAGSTNGNAGGKLGGGGAGNAGTGGAGGLGAGGGAATGTTGAGGGGFVYISFVRSV